MTTMKCSTCRARFNWMEDEDPQGTEPVLCMDCADATESDVLVALVAEGNELRREMAEQPVQAGHDLTQRLVAHVKAYAHAHYENGQGWDYVIEALSTSDLETMLKGVRTVKGATRKVWRDYVRVLGGQRREVMAEAF